MTVLARDLLLAIDAAEFARAAGVTPDPWQSALLRAQPKRTLILASRQVGKTTTTALLTLHVATFTPGALCVVISPSQRQSNEFIRTVRLLHQKLDAAPFRTESVTKLELANEARILALPGGEEGKTIRGLAGARLIVVDEASRVPDELMQAARPMLATNRDGALIALTTPWGRRGWFYEAWHAPGDDTWHKIKVSATDCPRITPEFLEEERRALGQMMFESEYGLIFHDNEQSVFPTSIIDSAFSMEVQPLWA